MEIVQRFIILSILYFVNVHNIKVSSAEDTIEANEATTDTVSQPVIHESVIHRVINFFDNLNDIEKLLYKMYVNDMTIDPHVVTMKKSIYAKFRNFLINLRNESKKARLLLNNEEQLKEVTLTHEYLNRLSQFARVVYKWFITENFKADKDIIKVHAMIKSNIQDNDNEVAQPKFSLGSALKYFNKGVNAFEKFSKAISVVHNATSPQNIQHVKNFLGTIQSYLDPEHDVNKREVTNNELINIKPLSGKDILHIIKCLQDVENTLAVHHSKMIKSNDNNLQIWNIPMLKSLEPIGQYLTDIYTAMRDVNLATA